MVNLIAVTAVVRAKGSGALRKACKRGSNICGSSKHSLPKHSDT